MSAVRTGIEAGETRPSKIWARGVRSSGTNRLPQSDAGSHGNPTRGTQCFALSGGGWYNRPVSDAFGPIWNLLRSPRRLSLIAGPCVIESEVLCLRVAAFVARHCARRGVPYVFKASFDKANRTAAKSFRGPGLDTGLAVLAKVRREVGVPVLTDIHTGAQAAPAAEVVDVLQIPAFLCRQTDLIAAAVATGRIVNLKKGQFLSPAEMGLVVAKAVEAGARRLLVTERGTTFGYHNLVVDMRCLAQLRAFGWPVIFDATHAVQLPGAGGDHSGGQREFVPVLARAAVAAGANGVFFETHPHPDHALSDGPNMIPLNQLPRLLDQLIRLHEAL